MAEVTVWPSGRSFSCQGKQTILESALAASVSLDFGCSAGTCGKCQAKLLRGEIERVRHSDYAVREAEKLGGCFLLCAHTAASSEVVIEAIEAGSSADISLQTIPARIKHFSRYGSIGIVSVQTPRTKRLRFLAGQNIRLTLNSGLHYDAPVASCPCDERNIEVYLRNEPENDFSSELFDIRSFPVPVTVFGPWGIAIGNHKSGTTSCWAYDNYVAPLRSWIEQQLTDDKNQQIKLVWHVSHREHFYLENLLRSWSDAFESFTYQVDILEPGSPFQVPGQHSKINHVLASGPTWYTQKLTNQLQDSGYTGPIHVHSSDGCPSPLTTPDQ